MDLFDAIFSRRSIRKYKPGKIKEADINEIIKAGMYAPSAVNKQPWHFVVFRNPKSIEQIMEIHPNASMLQNADLGILVCTDTELQHDEGYGSIDCAAATQNMLLAAHALGLGACWIGVKPREQRVERLNEIFNLPQEIEAFAVIALGHPGEQKEKPQRFRQERIHQEIW